jgi:hypothetical protein
MAELTKEKSDDGPATKDDERKDVLEIEVLDRTAPVSDTGRVIPIEDVRKKVIQNAKNIVVGSFKGGKRVSLYRNTYRVTTFAIKNDEDWTTDQIRERVKQKVLNGDFDREITEVYAELRKGIKREETS